MDAGRVPASANESTQGFKFEPLYYRVVSSNCVSRPVPSVAIGLRFMCRVFRWRLAKRGCC
eukprot:scaffold721_cov235-Pinguiococcus_pyrenoidosus.AAC.2